MTMKRVEAAASITGFTPFRRIRGRAVALVGGAFVAATLALGHGGASHAATTNRWEPVGPVVATFQGNGATCRGDGSCALGGGGHLVLTGTFHLEPGLVVVRARHQGSWSFTVRLLLTKPGVAPTDGFDLAFPAGITAKESFDASAVISTHRAGEYAVAIDVSGPYEIVIEQPAQGSMLTSVARDFSGTESQVPALIELPRGRYTVTATSTGKTTIEDFKVQLMDLDGRPISPDGTSENYLISETAPYSGSATFTVAEDGVYALAVTANNMGGEWTVSIR